MRRRRAMRLVEALIMGGAIRPLGSTVKPKPSNRNTKTAQWAAFAQILGSVLNHGIPRRGDHTVSRAVLFDIAEARERVVEALHHQLVRHQHVVNLAA